MPNSASDPVAVPKVKQDPALPYISELKLINNRCDLVSMDKIMGSIMRSTTLRRLSLQKMNLSERQLKKLFVYIKETNIQELDISWNKVPPRHLPTLFAALESNTSLQNLNLGWVQLNSTSNEELFDAYFPKFCGFLKHNSRLLHLNLTSIGLQEKYLLELICFLKRSQSLHCVHLCGNQFTEESVNLLNSKLKPTYINDMVTQPEKLERKKNLLQRIQKGIRENYHERYERIYDSVLTKDSMLEWLSVKEDY